MKQRRTATIVYRFLPQYRVDFFSTLRTHLADRDVDLHLVYGRSRDTSRQDERDIEWGTPVRNFELQARGTRLYWQHLPELVAKSDLLVLMQESRILSNYWLMLRSVLRGQKTAFWGHGVNFQDRADSWPNRF